MGKRYKLEAKPNVSELKSKNILDHIMILCACFILSATVCITKDASLITKLLSSLLLISSGTMSFLGGWRFRHKLRIVCFVGFEVLFISAAVICFVSQLWIVGSAIVATWIIESLRISLYFTQHV